ncbi:MAG: SCO family protein [Ideonella sp.]|nr:SCO family protein [Ideonella sp.]MCC7459188.1 SCO family protein [Nitrospira sp.]
MAVRRHAALLLVALALAVAAAAPARAQAVRAPTPSHLDPAQLEIDEARFLGTPIDGDLRLIGEDGRTFRLDELYGKPLLLLFSYYSCDGACPMVNRRLAEAIAGATRFRAGEDYRVLTVSFDRKDSAANVRKFVQQLGPGVAPQGWRFALFADDGDIQRIADKVGYKYFWSVRDRLFVHPNVLIVLTPEGRVARYLSSWTIGPRDIDLALIESDWMRIGASSRIIDIAAGICFSYSYKEGRYVLNAPLFVAAGSLTLGFAAVIAGFAVFRRGARKAGGISHA